jgi:hypothetical protein
VALSLPVVTLVAHHVAHITAAHHVLVVTHTIPAMQLVTEQDLLFIVDQPFVTVPQITIEVEVIATRIVLIIVVAQQLD